MRVLNSGQPSRALLQPLEALYDLQTLPAPPGCPVLLPPPPDAPPAPDRPDLRTGRPSPSSLTLKDMDDRLPAELRRSRLPWTPDLEHQSPAPAPNDSWAALVGTLEWSLTAHRDSQDEPPAFLLGLRDLALEDDAGHPLRSYPSLREAVVAAESAHDLLLEQLRQQLLRP